MVAWNTLHAVRYGPAFAFHPKLLFLHKHGGHHEKQQQQKGYISHRTLGNGSIAFFLQIKSHLSS
jgi:hypothetical protein